MNRKPRKLKRQLRFGPLLTAVLIAVILYAYVTQLNVNRALEHELTGVRKALHETNRNQLELESKVSAVQAAVVETKVALSTKESAEASVPKAEAKPVGKPVVNVKAREINYVDPVSTFIVGGVLQIGKAIITNGGKILAH